MKKILLGSSSPRRREILKSIIPDFEIVKPDTDESINPGEKPADYAERISAEKALNIKNNANNNSDSIIISSDTIVTIDNIILGKPEDYEHAQEMLNLLQGKSHFVITALTLLVTDSDAETEKVITSHEKTTVVFRELNKSEIERYLQLIHFMDKAGAYAIQDNGGLIIEKVIGSVTNVIGFPLRLFYSMMNRAGHLEDLLC